MDKYIVLGEEICLIEQILSGYNSITIRYINIDGKSKETTLSRFIFKTCVFENIETAMSWIVQSNYTSKRIFEYRYYLNKYYPEKLI